MDRRLGLAKTSFIDFCHLDEDEYAARIAEYTNPHLKKQEAVKTKQIFGGMWSIATGTAGVVITHGATIVVCALGARRVYVACRKLKLIRLQLQKRGVELRPFLHRDWMIPVAAGLIGAGIGFGVDFGLAALVPIPGLSVASTGLGGNSLAVLAPPPSGGSAGAVSQHMVAAIQAHNPSMLSHQSLPRPSILQVVSAVPRDPGNAVHDFGLGVSTQLHHLFAGSHEAALSLPSDNTLAGAAAFLGGMHAAQSVEHTVAAFLGSDSFSWMSGQLDMESLIPKMSRNLGCKRLAWSTSVSCTVCDLPIESGTFNHCCDCGGEDEFNLCKGCYESGKRCDSEKHLRLMQSAVPGDIYHPFRAERLNRAMSAPSTRSCTICERKITQGWYYECPECRKGREQPALCIDCYKQGATCDEADTHRLYAFLAAEVAKFGDKMPYEAPKKKAPTGSASCCRCKGMVGKGPYYHCKKCEDFDLCSECYQIGRTCRNQEHRLKKYYGWKYEREFDWNSKEEWPCSNERCRTSLESDDLFFSCTECDDGLFALCKTCYFTDRGCNVPDHDIFRCTFRGRKRG